MNTRDPDRRVALVTGANRGIGKEIARQLASHGLTVFLTARDASKAEAAAEELSGAGDVRGHRLDVTDGGSVDRLERDVEDDLGRLDVLVNNAGIALDAGQSAVAPDLDVMRETLETNLFGAWRVARAFIPLMRENRYGRIVNVSSGMGQFEDMGGGSPAYRVSKAGLNVMTKTLAAELSGSGILVNSVCPGWVRTDMGGSSARVSVEDGADTPVWLATLPDDGPTGGFFRRREAIPW